MLLTGTPQKSASVMYVITALLNCRLLLLLLRMRLVMAGGTGHPRCLLLRVMPCCRRPSIDSKIGVVCHEINCFSSDRDKAEEATNV
jgi:hypothetical protein